MPSFRVAIQGKTYQVEIPDPCAAPLQVIVDGQPFEISISDADGAAETPVASPPPAAAPASTPARPFPQPLRPVRAPAGASGVSGPEIAAPLPGTVIAIEVSAGQEVKTGQVLLILEAMKMKNPIRANREGRVTEVCVQPGQSVPHGAVLVRLD